ncbi:Uncharacterised protein [Mycobacteroides abscessus subsp. abscessus]|nr:Uncharacterised protein [Mycobacteroides abscessus subsp. abscessus]
MNLLEKLLMRVYVYLKKLRETQMKIAGLSVEPVV